MTSELPERRTSEGQASDTRASDSEREQIAERLRDAMAEGRLDMEEFDERLGLAYGARTHGELVPLVRDLPEPGSVRAAGVAASMSASEASSNEAGTSGGWADKVGRSPATSTTAFGVMGGFTRKGKWTVGRRFHATAVMGGGELDLREAQFEDKVTVIRCFTIMGGVQITAPPDLDVEVRGFGFMGGFGEVPDRDDVAHIGPSPDSPKVIVTGFALMGGVGVERKLRKEERRRLKEERKRGRLESKDAAHRDRHEDLMRQHRERVEDHLERHEERIAERRARHEERRSERRARRRGL